MDYKKKYKEALERAKRLHCEPTGGTERIVCEQIFPELKESENELKWLTAFIRKEVYYLSMDIRDDEDLIKLKNLQKLLAWLEKHGEHADFLSKIQVGDKVTRNEGGVLVNISQLERVAKPRRVNPTDKVEPKFHEGEWIITKANNLYQVTAIIDDKYQLKYEDIYSTQKCADVDESARLWTIQDAKDGDLIYVSTEEKGIQAIFHEYKNDTIFFHCYLCADFVQGGYMPIGSVELTYPLQKTHYNRFFEKMHEAGYEWDAEKKELKKIEDEIEIPFGAKDSELQEATYYIPKGFYAEIDDDKVVIKKR